MRLLVEGESLRESWDGKIELSLKWASGWWHLSKTGDDYSSPVARSKGAAVRRAFKLIGQNPGTLTVYRQDGSVEEGYQKPAGEAPDFHASSKFTGTVKPHTRSSELLSVDKEGAYVALSEPVEIDYWIKAFDCTKEQLQAAVEKVGNKVEDVKNEINRDRQ
ncbi:MAG: DUF3606 domain-containing protein [Verrucomicrobiaceae bacterium]|nr:MAG: DUF3606 domain-containing protein [Verrucomicrobiaceae bacterium]